MKASYFGGFFLLWRIYMKISKYYKLSDATASYTAAQKGIDNTDVSPEELERIGVLAHRTLEPIYEMYGRIFGISSWYRCPKLNRAVGGAKASEHMLGSAVDLIPLGMTAMELAQKIKSSKALYNKLILEYKNGKEWVHIQFRYDCEMYFDDFTYFGKRCYIGLYEHEPRGE